MTSAETLAADDVVNGALDEFREIFQNHDKFVALTKFSQKSSIAKHLHTIINHYAGYDREFVSSDAVFAFLLESGLQIYSKPSVQACDIMLSGYKEMKYAKKSFLLRSLADINVNDYGHAIPSFDWYRDFDEHYLAFLDQLLDIGLDLNHDFVEEYNRIQRPSIFSVCCYYLETDSMQKLLDCHLDVNGLDKDRNNALQSFVRSVYSHSMCDYEMKLNKGVQLLYSAGVNVLNVNKHHYSALMLADINNETELIFALVSNCPDVNMKRAMLHAQDEYGETILHRRSKRRHDYAERCEVLLKLGADVDVRNRRGETPLMIACEGKCYDVVETLVQYGADVHAITDEGMSVAEYASNGDEDLLKLLRALFKRRKSNSEALY